MKNKKIKQLAIKGIVNGKLKLGRVRPKLIGFFWRKGVTLYGAPRPVMMTELELKLAYNKANFVEPPGVWGMTNDGMLNSLKAGHRPAEMRQDQFMQEVSNHGSRTISVINPPICGKIYQDGDFDGDTIPVVNTYITLDPNPLTKQQKEHLDKWLGFTHDELKDMCQQEDNTLLLRTQTTYFINISQGFIVVDNRKYRFELEDNSLSLDVDGDWVSTHTFHNNLVCNASTVIGVGNYKEIRILGEL